MAGPPCPHVRLDNYVKPDAIDESQLAEIEDHQQRVRERVEEGLLELRSAREVQLAPGTNPGRTETPNMNHGCEMLGSYARLGGLAGLLRFDIGRGGLPKI